MEGVENNTLGNALRKKATATPQDKKFDENCVEFMTTL